MARGLYPGVAPDTWRAYPSDIRVCSGAATGAPTQVTKGATTIDGRWQNFFGTTLIAARITMTVGSGWSGGSGDVYTFRLPFPCNRSQFGADQVLGSAFLHRPSTGWNMEMLPTNADDFAYGGLAQTEEDYWCHLFIPKSGIAQGTGTVAQSTSSVTVNHGLAITPHAGDITITPTNSPTTNPQMIMVQNIGATSFDVVTKVSLTTGTLPFSWKAEVEPNSTGGAFPQLFGPGQPWSLAASDLVQINMLYQPR